MERIIENDLKKSMSSSKTILVRGVRGCGKTKVVSGYVNSKVDLTDENIVKIANTKADILLNSEKPIMIEEYGNAPKIVETIKEKAKKNGDFILTSSTNLSENFENIETIEMKPLTLFESGKSNGKISLKELLEKEIKIDDIETELDYEKIAYEICKGGFSKNENISEKEIQKANNEYVKELIEKDIKKIDNVKRNSKLADELLKTYAEQISTISSDRELIDATSKKYGKISDKTIYNYINQFKKLFIIEEIKGWQAKFRNKTTVRLSPKKFFVDPSIGTSLLGMNPNKLMMNFDLYTKMLKNLVYRDLSVYSRNMNSELKYYEDRYGLKCDFVLENESEVTFIDVQLSEHYIEESINHLLKIKKLMNKEEKKINKMIIITAGTKAEKIEEGILIVPIGCLKD